MWQYLRSNYKLGLYRVRELRHDRNEREQRDPGRQHRQTELRVAIQFPRLGSDVDHALLSLRLRPGDDACVRRRLARAVKRYKH